MIRTSLFVPLFLIILAAILISSTTAFAGDTTGVKIKATDSVLIPTGTPARDSIVSQTETDSAKTNPAAVTADSAQINTAAAPANDSTVTKALTGSNLKLVKRAYNSKQQVILATGMMIFVVLIMTLAQQFNPG